MTALKPTEYKSVQSRILKYAKEIGWAVVSQSEAEPERKQSMLPGFSQIPYLEK